MNDIQLLHFAILSYFTASDCAKQAAGSCLSNANSLEHYNLFLELTF